MKSYFVFACPKCHHFTLAPVGQKKRRCSYCGKIIDIRKALKTVFGGHDRASAAVREYNAGGDEEFRAAVEKSKKRVKALMPAEKLTVEDLETDEEPPPSTGKRRRLLKMLEKEAKGQACSLERIEKLCEEYKLEWSWVEEQISKMSNEGNLIFPRPWSVQMVGRIEDDEESTKRDVDVSDEIVEMLRKRDGSANLDDIIKYFHQKGVSESSVESSLEKLMRNGHIFAPSRSKISLV